MHASVQVRIGGPECNPSGQNARALVGGRLHARRVAQVALAVGWARCGSGLALAAVVSPFAHTFAADNHALNFTPDRVAREGQPFFPHRGTKDGNGMLWMCASWEGLARPTGFGVLCRVFGAACTVNISSLLTQSAPPNCHRLPPYRCQFLPDRFRLQPNTWGIAQPPSLTTIG